MEEKEAYGKLREVVRIFERNLGALKENEITCCGITMAQCHACLLYTSDAADE